MVKLLDCFILLSPQNIHMFVVSLSIITFVLSKKSCAQPQQSYNLMNFGALGDGIHDDSQAFSQAWNRICQSQSQTAALNIPKRTFMTKALEFQGPCKPSNITIKVLGSVYAPSSLYGNQTTKAWLTFSNVDGLSIDGSDPQDKHARGSIDGRGKVWWSACKNSSTCPERPATISFNRCNNLKLQTLGFFNSPGNHISIGSCTNVDISRLLIRAPPDSPNTDGIDISFSNGVNIRRCNIQTGDDCIAITNNSHDINITKIACGPGHGISVGSLGKAGGNDSVERVHVRNCTFSTTQNGARIKTWQGGSGFARNIVFEDIILKNASNPIVIDQYYCPNQYCLNQTSAVKISDITFRNMFGTSHSEAAVILHCSQSIGCTNINVQQINITSSLPGKKTYSDCLNAHGQSTNAIPDVSCLKLF